jgi:hypothetical protein
MTTHRQVDEPSPTIVGPRPDEGAGGKVSIPQGLERLLTLAGISAEWRSRVLAEPLAAAAEAKIELSASERAILKAVPRPTLEGMVASFARKHGSSAIVRYATGAVAAAALLATGIAYGADSPATKGGVRADEPEPKRPVGMETEGGIRPDVPEEAKPVLWMTALEDALAQAKKDNRAVLAVFLPAAKVEAPKPPPPPTRGISIDRPRPSAEEKSRKVVLTDSKEFRSAMKGADLVAVRVAKPVANPVDPEKEKDAYDKAMAAYEAALKKYGLEEGKLPAVVFLAPDGTEFAKLVQPDEEAKLIEGIKATPPQLAKWITEQRKAQPPPAATDGIRPDTPATKGIRPDIPEGKL